MTRLTIALIVGLFAHRRLHVSLDRLNKPDDIVQLTVDIPERMVTGELPAGTAEIL